MSETTIVVGVDFSDGSSVAFRHAVEIARAWGARLRVAHIVEDDVLDELSETLRVARHELARRITHQMRLAVEGWVREQAAEEFARVEVHIGSVVGSLVAASRRKDTALLVLGLNGWSRHAQGAGIVALKCARLAASDVLLVHPSRGKRLARLTIGIDFSPVSQTLVERALKLGQGHATVHLLHVVRRSLLSWIVEVSKAERGHFLSEQRALLEAWARKHLRGLPADRIQAEIVEADTYAEGIVEAAHKARSELVVVGKKGRHSLRYMLLGTTSEGVLRDAETSVLVVRS